MDLVSCSVWVSIRKRMWKTAIQLVPRWGLCCCMGLFNTMFAWAEPLWNTQFSIAIVLCIPQTLQSIIVGLYHTLPYLCTIRKKTRPLFVILHGDYRHGLHNCYIGILNYCRSLFKKMSLHLEFQNSVTFKPFLYDAPKCCMTCFPC